MEFGMDKCAVLMMKGGKMIYGEGLTLPSGVVMNEVDEKNQDKNEAWNDVLRGGRKLDCPSSSPAGVVSRPSCLNRPLYCPPFEHKEFSGKSNI